MTPPTDIAVARPSTREPAGPDLVRQYLDEIGTVPLLTKDDEGALARRIEAGRAAAAELEAATALTPARRAALRRAVRDGEDAFADFVRANLRLVVSVARRYQHRGASILDLIQEGNLGLIRAVEKFEWRKGFKFSTYATWWIRQSIQRSLASSTRAIRLPVHAWEELTALSQATSRLEAELRRPPTRAELVDATGLAPDRIDELQAVGAEPRSLDEAITDDADAVLGDLVEDRAALDPAAAAMLTELPGIVADMLSVLDERERFIVARRYGLGGDEPRSFAEVGSELHLTRERVRQLEARALSKLRHPSNAVDGRGLLAG